MPYSNKQLPSEFRCIQIYRDAIKGKTKAEKLKSLTKELDLYKLLGITAIAYHGFTTEMTVEVFKPLAQLCIDRGMLALAAYGLDSSDPIGKAERMALVANLPECFALVLDMEGKFEDELSDKQTIKIMGKKLRELCPNCLMISQDWFAARSHWSMYGWEEIFEFVDMTFPQVYAMNFKNQYGNQAYEKVWEWYQKDWKVLEDRLRPKNLIRPRKVTLQGYKWPLEDNVDVLLKNPACIIWAEPYLDETFVKAFRIVKKLKELGFEGPEAIKNFQLSTNGELNADNICGNKTIKKLGF